jgi:hypothetical protein
MPELIKINGWSDFSRNLRKIDNEAPKMLRLVANDAANIVVDWARPKVPVGKSGRAQKSVKAKSLRTAAQVQGGSKNAPYYPWLDFGGRVGKRRSVKREFVGDGRYIYPGLANNNDAVHKRLIGGMLEIVEAAGIEVDQ